MVTLENSDELAKDLLSLEEDGIDDITLDFDGMERLPSLAIGALYLLAEGVQKRGGTIRFVNISPLLGKLFELTDLKNFIQG